MSIKLDDPLILCEWARDIGKSYAFLDFHVHPYDVLSGDTRFKPDPQTDGLFTRGFFRYHPPIMECCTDTAPDRFQSVPDNQRAFLLAGRCAYSHTGPKVFADQMNLVGISGALLLPVARTAGQAEEMLAVSQKMFQANNCLLLGCAFPIGIQAEKLADYFRLAYSISGIRAIKLHPNLAALDPLSQKGQDLIEASLEVAGELNLPVVIHGGRTPSIEPVEAREYGTIPHLATINWSISTAPVIIAHAGCYGLTDMESIDALAILGKLLSKHSNLMADISNLEPSILRLVMEKISPERLIFGSDALYIPIWKAWVKFLQTLQLVSSCPDDDLIRIASFNPAQCLSRS